MPINILAQVALFVLVSLTGVQQLNGSSSTVTEDPLSTLQRTSALLNGSHTLKDATLIGTVRQVTGSDDNTGEIVYKATPSASRMEMSFSAGNRIEVRSNDEPSPFGRWTGPDGTEHNIAQHNIRTDPGWFPAFILGNLVRPNGTALANLGQETWHGASVIHIRAVPLFSDFDGEAQTVLQQGSQLEIYLDPATLLPAAVAFGAHPDDDIRFNIPTEVRFSDYRVVNGLAVPFHIEKYINNSLSWDIHLGSFVANSGISSSEISGQ